MAGVNKVILIGNLGADPEVRALESGVKVATINLATSENYKDKNGERQTQTEWHRVVLWRAPLVLFALRGLKPIPSNFQLIINRVPSHRISIQLKKPLAVFLLYPLVSSAFCRLFVSPTTFSCG